MSTRADDDPAADMEAIRNAARALALQQGEGISRSDVLPLASRPLRLTLLRPRHEDEPVVALISGEPGIRDDDPFASLTAREREVAALIARGEPNKRIALTLDISTATVKDHVHRILVKTSLGNRAAVAAAWARR